jgi:ubiquinone/menaquinone biosynthesis C-methylase UbiE
MLGDGDGRFLQVFQALYPQAQIEAVDVSAKMIELAKARAERVAFHLCDSREFGFEGEYDLAVAHFFFDCFEEAEIEAMLARINTKSWVISEFRNTKWSWPVLRGLYFFFRLTTGLRVRSLPNHRKILEKLGYRMEKEQTALRGLLASEMWTNLL